MIHSQLTTFLIYIGGGLAISLLFDFFRALRKTIKTNTLATIIEDIIFWTITCIFTIFLIEKFNYGELRIYILVGICIGVICYYLLFSRLILKLNIVIMSHVKKFIVFSLKIIHKPVCLLVINLKKLVKKLK